VVVDVSLDQAWDLLGADRRAVLIDVRTVAEWTFVGVPVLDGSENELRFVEWNTFPAGTANPDFLAVAAADLELDQPILFLCRSGARSAAAARAFERLGFRDTYNITAGFEGAADGDGHRRGGWKHEGLPWRQS
jgi:rhodanese-related sulfurtransferase